MWLKEITQCTIRRLRVEFILYFALLFADTNLLDFDLPLIRCGITPRRNRNTFFVVSCVGLGMLCVSMRHSLVRVDKYEV